jgi:hypothetical protein
MRSGGKTCWALLVMVAVVGAASRVCAYSVAIISPAKGATVSGTTSIAWTEAAPRGALTSISIDSTLLLVSSLYNSAAWNTSTVSNGIHTIHARLYSSNGNLLASTQEQLRIANLRSTPTLAPTPAPTPTRTIALTPAPTSTLPAPTPAATSTPLKNSYYGSGVGMTSLNNNELQGLSLEDYRFRANQTGPLSDFRLYICENTLAGAGYCNGTGGSINFTLESDSGGFASGTVLAGPVNLSTPCGAGSSAAFPVVNFSPAPILAAGAVYHLVMQNGDANPSANWNSIDQVFVNPATTPAQPTSTDSSWASLFSNDGVNWITDNPPNHVYSNTPILDLNIGGTHQGIGYMELSGTTHCVGVSSGACQDNGYTNEIGEDFTPTQTRVVTSISLRALLAFGQGALTMQLLQGSTVVTQAIFPSSDFLGDGNPHWPTAMLAAPATLVSGTEYKLIFSTDTTTSYQTIALRDGKAAGYGFDAATVFADGVAQRSPDGVTWTNWETNGTAANDQDLQFYFAVEGP